MSTTPVALLADVQAGFTAVNTSLGGKASAAALASAAATASTAKSTADQARTDAAEAKSDAAAALDVAYNGGTVITNQAMTPVAKSRLTIT